MIFANLTILTTLKGKKMYQSVEMEICVAIWPMELVYFTTEVLECNKETKEIEQRKATIIIMKEVGADT